MKNERFPVSQSHPSHREARTEQTPVSCDAWGARIQTTLLIDLSEEDRRSLAEHTKVCSACAARVRRYQLIEEAAGALLWDDVVEPCSTNTLFSFVRR
jgi:anti-sigma factor RsiW